MHIEILFLNIKSYHGALGLSKLIVDLYFLFAQNNKKNTLLVHDWQLSSVTKINKNATKINSNNDGESFSCM